MENVIPELRNLKDFVILFLLNIKIVKELYFNAKCPVGLCV